MPEYSTATLSADAACPKSPGQRIAAAMSDSVQSLLSGTLGEQAACQASSNQAGSRALRQAI